MNERRLNAQVGVLGSLLIDDAAAGRVLHRLREEDFTASYRTVFRAIRDLFLEGKPVDPTLVASRLGKQYEDLLLQIMEVTPTAANVDLYVDAALEEAQLQRLRDLAGELQQSTDLETSRKVISRINRDLGSRPTVRVMTIAQGIQDFYARQQTKPTYLTWGMEKLDGTVMTEPGDFVVIGGYPSAGKTAFSIQLAWSQAKQHNVGYFSLETKPEKLVDRAMAMVTGVKFGDIKRHALTEEDWKRCKEEAPGMADRRLTLIQAGGMTAADIQSRALAGQFEIIYVDYLQLIAPADNRRTDFEQISQISKDLHTMAQTTGITVVALSQLTRPESKKGDGGQERAPTMHNLRQSGQIEQDADSVMLLYRTNSKDPKSPRALKVAKNKEGEAGGILELAFDGSTQRFTPIVPTGTEAVRQYVDAGKKAKQANRMSGQTTFQELPPSDDDPWKGGPP